MKSAPSNSNTTQNSTLSEPKIRSQYAAQNQPRRFPLWWLAIPAALLIGAASWREARHPRPPADAARERMARTENFGGKNNSNGASAPTSERALRDSWRVVKTIPHDRNAFLQGLLWEDGGFYESTGIEGESSLRRLEYPSGKVLKQKELPADVFGEGLVAWKDKLIQITWQSQRAYVWDKNSFELKNQFDYQGEGWGITQDGKSLIMSDGSDKITFRDPETFTVQHIVPVTINGQPQANLNELEWINGEIWANIWQTDIIARIDPQSGHITSFLDLSNLLPASARNGHEDVLNGIAYDPKTKRIWISGKRWPSIFEITVAGLNNSAPAKAVESTKAVS